MIRRLAVVSSQRRLEQTRRESAVTESIRVASLVGRGRPLRGGVRPGPGHGQILLGFAARQPLLGGCCCRGGLPGSRRRRLAVGALHLAAGAAARPLGGGEAPRVLLRLPGSLQVLADIVLGAGAHRHGLRLGLGEENALEPHRVRQKEESPETQRDQTGEEEQEDELLGQAQAHARGGHAGQLAEHH